MLTSLLTKLVFVSTAFADGTTPPSTIDITLPNPIGATQSIPTLIGRAFTGLVWVAAFVAPIFIVWGAFQILTSAGNSEKLASGKKTILYTVIGFLVVLGAKGIVDIVQKALTIR
jgi:hypothetical protein